MTQLCLTAYTFQFFVPNKGAEMDGLDKIYGILMAVKMSVVIKFRKFSEHNKVLSLMDSYFHNVRNIKFHVFHCSRGT